MAILVSSCYNREDCNKKVLNTFVGQNIKESVYFDGNYHYSVNNKMLVTCSSTNANICIYTLYSLRSGDPK